jgi:hypothetical protein
MPRNREPVAPISGANQIACCLSELFSALVFIPISGTINNDARHSLNLAGVRHLPRTNSRKKK